MIAETAFNVIEVLSPEEKKRLLEMMNVEVNKPPSKKEKHSIISDTQCREIIINHFKRFSKRFKEKNHKLIKTKVL